MRLLVNEAVGAARRHERRRERTVPLEEGAAGVSPAQLTDPEKGPQELAEEAEERRRVWAALGKLPPAQRAAVVQRYYLGMSEAEMAEGGESPPGTIKSRLNAARKGLLKLLRPRSHTEVAPATVGHSTPAALSLDEEQGGNERG